jgi:redox-sensitive bicupin YhaK (pirin superfamily)
MLFERENSNISLTASEDSTLLFLGGDPIDEPVCGHGPFVMNSRAEIRQAIADFNNGKFGRIE